MAATGRLVPAATAILLAGALPLLAGTAALGRQALSEEDRAAFREAVDGYQIFVVPHCAPDDVRTYVTTRGYRDRAFVRSLRGTVLASDYQRAVAEGAERDSRTIYECLQPPPPPGTQPPDAAEREREHSAALADFLAGGDRQFETMKALRDRLIGAGKRR